MSVDSSFLSFSANQIWSRRNILLLRRFVSCVANINCALFGFDSGELNISMIFLVSNGCNFASSSSMTSVWPFIKVSMMGPDILRIFFVPSDSISSTEKNCSVTEPSFEWNMCPDFRKGVFEFGYFFNKSFFKSSGKSGGRVSSKFISVFFKLENPKSMLSKKLFALIASGESFVM